MKSTIYDIARESGVSIATVSRVINNNEKVAVKTREKVLSVAKSLGYHPRALAQSLARQKTKVITAIVPIISNYFFMEVLAGMQDKIADFDYDLNIYNVKYSADLRTQIEHIIRKGMAEGYIIISVHLKEDDWAYLTKYNVPITLIDEYTSKYDTISVDSVEGATTATQYLLDSGYKRIGLICGHQNSQPVKDRTLGYRRAIEDAGLRFNNELVIGGTDMERDGFNERNGYQAMQKMLQLSKPAEACVCASDIQALGAIKAMKDYGYSIPIIGFDDLDFSEYLGLTTMRQPMYEMGALAIDKLTNRIHNREKAVSNTIFSPELIIRTKKELFL